MFTVYSYRQPFRVLQSVPPNITIFRWQMDSMKNRQKPSAGYRNAEHLSMLCAGHALCWIVADRIQISTGCAKIRVSVEMCAPRVYRLGLWLRESF
jgi:hypothetical protein